MTPPNGQKEAFSRVVIDAQLKDVGWDLTDGHSVRYEYQLPDGTLADYVLCDRHGRAAAVIEAKRASVNLQEPPWRTQGCKAPLRSISARRECLFLADFCRNPRLRRPCRGLGGPGDGDVRLPLEYGPLRFLSARCPVEYKG